MPFDATGFEDDPVPPLRRLEADSLTGLLVLALLAATLCCSAWIVWFAKTDAAGLVCCAVAFAYGAIGVAATIVCWSRC